jgi:hypothetical protein
VEAVLKQHDAVGFEINPYAAFVSRIKTDAGAISVPALQEEIVRFRRFCSEAALPDYQARSVPPEGFRTRAPFYSPNVLQRVLRFFDSVESIGEIKIKNLFRLAFGSTMVQYSNYSYEPSLSRRVSAGISGTAPGTAI